MNHFYSSWRHFYRLDYNQDKSVRICTLYSVHKVFWNNLTLFFFLSTFFFQFQLRFRCFLLIFLAFPILNVFECFCCINIIYFFSFRLVLASLYLLLLLLNKSVVRFYSVFFPSRLCLVFAVY